MKTDLFTSVLIRDTAHGHIDFDHIEGYIRHLEAFSAASGLRLLQWPLDVVGDTDVAVMAHNIEWVRSRDPIGYRILALEISAYFVK